MLHVLRGSISGAALNPVVALGLAATGGGLPHAAVAWNQFIELKMTSLMYLEVIFPNTCLATKAGCFEPAFLLWCAHVRTCLHLMFYTFRGKRKRILVFLWFQVDFSWQVQDIGGIGCAGFVAGAVIWTW